MPSLSLDLWHTWLFKYLCVNDILSVKFQELEMYFNNSPYLIALTFPLWNICDFYILSWEIFLCLDQCKWHSLENKKNYFHISKVIFIEKGTKSWKNLIHD